MFKELFTRFFTKERVKKLAIITGVVGLLWAGAVFKDQPMNDLFGATVFLEYQGGTSESSYTKGDILYASNTNTLDKLAVGSAGQVLKVASGVPSWGTDNTGGGGGTQIEIRDIPGAYDTNTSSVSFDGGKFTIVASGSAAHVNLDWGSGGPASLSQAETITGDWVNTANPWADNEVANDITASNYLPLAGGTLTGPLIGTSASLTINFETVGYASASFYKGSGLPASNCNSTGQVMRWATTGLFTCGTLSTSDIDYSAVFQGLDSDLTALANNSTNGLWARTGSGTGSARTLTGTANQITVTNGDGVSGNPTFTIPSVFIAPGTASVTTNFEAIGFASASSFFGSGLPASDCSNTTSSKLLWNITTGVFSCGTDQTGGGGGTQIELKDVPGLYNSNVSSVSFDGGKFTITASGSAGLVNLDWGSGGPASLSEAETISGNWVNTTNPWADNEVADILTLNGGTIGNNTLSSGATFTGSASLSANFEVVGYASASQYFGGFASHTFQGTIVGTGDGLLTLGSSVRALKEIWSKIVRATVNLFIPNGTGGASANATSAGSVAVDTASRSFNFGDGTNENVVDPKRCVSQSLAYSDLTSLNQWTIFTADDPWTIDSVQVTASGSNALGWQLRTGSLTVPTTNVFSSTKSASGSGVTKYTSFATSAISDGQKLDLQVASTSATLDSVFIRACLRKTP